MVLPPTIMQLATLLLLRPTFSTKERALLALATTLIVSPAFSLKAPSGIVTSWLGPRSTAQTRTSPFVLFEISASDLPARDEFSRTGNFSNSMWPRANGSILMAEGNFSSLDASIAAAYSGLTVRESPSSSLIKPISLL